MSSRRSRGRRDQRGAAQTPTPPGSSQARETQPAADTVVLDAVKFLKRCRAARASLVDSCRLLKASINISHNQLDQALVLLRDPFPKTFECSKKMCSSGFAAELNLKRHQFSHSISSRPTSTSKVVSRDDFISHWISLSDDDTRSLKVSVLKKAQDHFGDYMGSVFGDMNHSPDYPYLPQKVVNNADNLIMLTTGDTKGPEKSEFPLLQFLDECSENNFLRCDLSEFEIHGHNPQQHQRTLESETIVFLAYYSLIFEKKLVKSLNKLRDAQGNALMKELEDSQQRGRLVQKGKELVQPLDLPADLPDQLPAAALPPALPPVDTSEPTSTSGDAAASTSGAPLATAKSTTVILEVEAGPRFLDFLKRFSFSKSKSSTPYFKQQLLALDKTNDSYLPIFYSVVESHDRDLALMIRDHAERVHPFLEDALETFINDSGYSDVWPDKRLKFEFIGCPAPNSTEPFLKYMQQRDIVEIFELLPTVDIPVRKILLLTKFGRKLARYLMRYILKKHRRGRCWFGRIRAKHIEVLRGSVFRIINLSDQQATKDGIYEDWMAYFEILKEYFCHPDLPGSAPIFFDGLLADLMQCPAHDSDDFGYFFKTISVHLSVMPPEAWIDLLIKLDQITHNDWFSNTILDVHYPWIPPSVTWVSPFKDVYEYKAGPGLTRYINTLRNLLRYVRNAPLHTLKLIQVLKLSAQVGDSTFVAILTADHLGQGLLDLFKTLTKDVMMDKNGVLAEEYLNCWTNFVNSDDHSDDVLDVNSDSEP